MKVYLKNIHALTSRPYYGYDYYGYEKHSRPYYGYDAGFDPTILNAVRNRYVDVSGMLIPNYALSKRGKDTINMTQRPLRPYGRIV